jgi:TPP-dependent pyruvate/acetoin dehydrogenase alpha subunit
MFRAVDYLKAEEQPVFIQADTFRFEGHYFGEPEVNRDKDQIRQMRESQDPIERFVFWLQDRYEDDIIERIDQVKQSAFDEIESACGFAENGSDPAPETYAEYIYA